LDTLLHDRSSGHAEIAAELSPGRAVRPVPIKLSFDLLRHPEPPGLLGLGTGSGTDQATQIVGRVHNQCAYSLGSALVEGVVDAGECPRQLGAALDGCGESQPASLLVFAQLAEPLPGPVFGLDGLVEALPLIGDLGSGPGNRVMVSSPPPSLAGLLKPFLRFGQIPVGVPTRPGGADQIPSSLVPLAVPVSGDARLNVTDIFGQHLAGLAQLVDPVGEGIISPYAADDRVAPVMIDTVLSANLPSREGQAAANPS
jgi:hypothetical protein